ncbi:MAG TPA: GNAT family N-acetyltransferase [Acidimicrobiales bacterium]|nr:GNAT family N-acetyltransferase [Acidimicrobiales bacterium]
MELRWLHAGDVDAVVGAGHLFDDDATREWAERFLDEPTHHLCIAYVDGEPAGFVSGMEMTHPDKGTEMFLYELGVDERHQGQGIATALIETLADLAAGRGCYGMWVLTDDDNAAAMSAYTRAGARNPTPQTMLEWTFN